MSASQDERGGTGLSHNIFLFLPGKILAAGGGWQAASSYITI